MGSNEEVAGSSDPKSPIRKGQPSPIGSDVMSPHQVSNQSVSRDKLYLCSDLEAFFLVLKFMLFPFVVLLVTFT